MTVNEQIYKIPPTRKGRSGLRELIGNLTGSLSLVPPVSMDYLHDLSDRLIRDYSLEPEIKGWLMVEINNHVWKDVVSSIPYEKRILLLPKCLSNTENCSAVFDELGLLCHRCNSCSIPYLQDKAEKLGMMSIVAEGFTSVIGLIKNKIVDTVIGVGCLDSLEKAFPLLINNAVPGLAIPLNKAGCKDTTVDFEYVESMISLSSGKEIELLDYDYIESSVQKWFSPDNLKRMIPQDKDHTSVIAHEWLSGDGKRWRPYLLAAVYQALSGVKEISEEVQAAAIAIECFHKASLVHDDIQDNDAERYGKQTVNAAYGDSVAINVGDILLGQGYSLLTKTGKMELIRVAADAHMDLCKGQGMELGWSLKPHSLTMDFVLHIFCNKTVPAFDVSLIMGLICAGGSDSLRKILHNYSKALGIAYQLFDDIEDFGNDAPIVIRPSAVLAILCEQSTENLFIEELLHADDLKGFLYRKDNREALDNALSEVKSMADRYRRDTFEILNAITDVELKRLLFRVTRKILK
jgi:geranylgeranyl pyrophosphate synthase